MDLPAGEWHDVRRSLRSWCAKSGIQPDAAETALGHAVNRSEVAKAYQKHKFEAEAEAVFIAWQSHIRGLVTGEAAAANVVSLRGI